MYPRTENTPEVHPLLRYPITVAQDAVFPEISINHTDPDSKTEAFITLKETGPEKENMGMIVPPMVLEAMKIVAQQNPEMAEGTQMWGRMCLGVLHRYNSMGYVNYEPVNPS